MKIFQKKQFFQLNHIEVKIRKVTIDDYVNNKDDQMKLTQISENQIWESSVNITIFKRKTPEMSKENLRKRC